MVRVAPPFSRPFLLVLFAVGTTVAPFSPVLFGMTFAAFPVVAFRLALLARRPLWLSFCFPFLVGIILFMRPLVRLF